MLWDIFVILIWVLGTFLFSSINTSLNIVVDLDFDVWFGVIVVELVPFE